jgi:UDP-glucose 4-epimerase
MNLLVIGGAGFIGSHLVKKIINSEHAITVLDNLSTGYRDAVMCKEFIFGDIGDRKLLDKVFFDNKFDAVLHFASFSESGESLKKPDIYYHNNAVKTQNLLSAMNAAGVKKIIFSSTAAIYGEPNYIPISEAHNKSPINPYGRSKWMVEQMLEDYDYAYGLKSICLRYFNAAGADPQGILGERHKPESHLIPVLLQVSSGRLTSATVYGNDYPTPDGTCIRDYVHVMDLCEAHILALDYLEAYNQSARFNLGNGNGFSVAKVIEAVKIVTKKNIVINYAERRKGDPAILVADSTLAKAVLGWNPRYSNLEEMVVHAWNFEQKQISKFN